MYTSLLPLRNERRYTRQPSGNSHVARSSLIVLSSATASGRPKPSEIVERCARQTSYPPAPPE